MTEHSRGAGVVELIDRLIATDLAEVDARGIRESVALLDVGGDTLKLLPVRQSVPLAGASGDGKSTLSARLLERLNEKRFQYCVIDPEGDYEGIPEAVGIGSATQAPAVASVMELLRKTGNNILVNLLGVPLNERPAFLANLLPELLSLRARTGRPHFIVVDEAHHMLRDERDRDGAVMPADLKGFLFIAVHPDRLSPRVVDYIDRIVVVGLQPCATLATFCDARRLCEPRQDLVLQPGEAFTLTPDQPDPIKARIIAGTGQRRRHLRKYAEGRLGEDKSFFFRGVDQRLNLRAHNLTMFVELADGVDPATRQWHRERGDYSRWIALAIKDAELAGEVEEIEQGSHDCEQACQQLRAAVERRYTLPA